MKRTPIALLAFLPFAACAGYDIDPVDHTKLKTWADAAGPGEGYIIYEPEPYLQVVLTPASNPKAKTGEMAEPAGQSGAAPSPAGNAADSTKGAASAQTKADTRGTPYTATAQIIYLPNRNRPYRVRTHAFLATADIKLAYRDGWMLTSAESNVDTAGVVKAVIEAAKGLAAAATRDEEPKANVMWFRFVFDKNTGHLEGLERVDDLVAAMSRKGGS